MTRRWALRLAAGLALTAVVLSSCSQRQEANDSLPPATQTTEAEEELGPPEQPMPREAMEKSADGFNAFTEYYIELVNRLQRDLDPTYLRRFSRGCETCERIARDAENDARNGYHYEGGAISITSIAQATIDGSEAETAFIIEQAAYSVIDGAGSKVPGLSSEALVDVPAGISGVWSENHWVVTNLSFG